MKTPRSGRPADAPRATKAARTRTAFDAGAVVDDGLWALPVPAGHVVDSSTDSDTDTVDIYVTSFDTELPAPQVG